MERKTIIHARRSEGGFSSTRFYQLDGQVDRILSLDTLQVRRKDVVRVRKMERRTSLTLATSGGFAQGRAGISLKARATRSVPSRDNVNGLGRRGMFEVSFRCLR